MVNIARMSSSEQQLEVPRQQKCCKNVVQSTAFAATQSCCWAGPAATQLGHQQHVLTILIKNRRQSAKRQMTRSAA
jgi:hypothetical protein